MDTLAAFIHSLFAQSYREHPAPPLMEKLKKLLQQRRLVQADRKKLPPALQKSPDYAKINEKNEKKTEIERTESHG